MIFGILFYKNGVYQETELEKKTYATNNFSIGCYFEPYRFWDFIIRQNTKTKRETPIFIVSSSLRDKMAVWNGIDYMYIIFLFSVCCFVSVSVRSPLDLFCCCTCHPSVSDEWIFQSFSSNWNEWFDSRNYREFDGSEIFSMDIKFFSDDLMQTKEREEEKKTTKKAW